MCDLCFCRIWPSSGQPALHQRDDQHRTCQQGWKPAGRGHYSEGRVVYIPCYFLLINRPFLTVQMNPYLYFTGLSLSIMGHALDETIRSHRVKDTA